MNEDQFVALYVKHQSMIKAFIMGMVRDPVETGEVFSNTSVVLFQKQDEFEKSRDFGAWARGIAKNKVYEHWRAQKREHTNLSEETMRTIEKKYKEREPHWWETYKEYLRKCMDKLSSGSVEMLKRYYWQEETSSDISEEEKPGSVRMKLTRIRRALRKCIDSYIRA